MKLNTALKLSALTVALASTSAMAATLNSTVLNQVDNANAVVALDKAPYQYADFGSSTGTPQQVGTPSTPRPVYVAEHNVNGTQYYLVDGKQILKANADKTALVATSEVTTSQLTTANFTRGGTSTNFQQSDVEQTSTIKRIDSTFVQYGEKTTTTTGVATGNVAVTNATGDDVSPFTIDVAGQANSTKKDDVVLGIIDTDASGKNVYGVAATKTDEKGNPVESTVLTSEGIKTTGDITFVDAATQKETSVKGYLEETSKAVNTQVNTALQGFETRANQLNNRINDVKETAYSGIAIALAAQQQVPNIGAGQVAVFGGVGHYESETAGALGLIGVLEDGRTSLSAAFGVAGSGDIGGRAGVSYVFGGK